MTFDVNTTRKAFEDQLIKDLGGGGWTEEDLREYYLRRCSIGPDDYYESLTQIEWQGWKRGVMMGYELWGKK